MMPIYDEFAAATAPSIAQLKAYGQQIAAQWQVPWPIFDAMITVESGWSTSPNEVSPAGAQGIAQIMPGTAADWGVNPWDPFQALNAAAMHLSEYYTQFGNSWANALAAYNGGASSQGMANAFAGGYPQKVLGIAQSLGADLSSIADGGTSASSSSSGSGSSTSSSTPANPVQIGGGTLAAILLVAVVLAIVGIAIA